MPHRMEKDSLGKLSINHELNYGIQTQRALHNFSIEYHRVPKNLIKSIILIKKCAASVNQNSGFMSPAKAQAIINACDDLLNKEINETDFPLPALQGGAGTSIHMNVNEVIANLALVNLGKKRGEYQYLHPNDDVNKFQSTNDVFPSALKIAAIQTIFELAEELAELQNIFQLKEKEFAAIIKTGRTEMQDALPITIGQEFGAYAEALGRDRWRIYKSEERLRKLNIGGTAIGTGTGAPKIFIFKLIQELRNQTNLGISRAENSIDMTQNADVYVEVSGLLKALASNFIKIASDLRLMSSGPNTGFQEINLPELQPGSSIMPGKVNPVIPELINGIGIQVIANDTAITYAASSGQLELNAFIPIIAYNLLDSIKLLKDGARIFRTHCIQNITVNEEHIRKKLENSDVYATLLVSYIGYQNCTELVSYAKRNNMTIREATIKMGYFNEEELNYIFHSNSSTAAGIPGSEYLKERIRF